MYHDGQSGGAVTKGGKETGYRRGMWQRNRLFPPRGPIVIYAPENDPLPTWNIKNHARTWKFRKKDDDDGSDGNGSGNGDSEKDLAQFCTSPPETQRSQSRRWPCRSVSGGRSQLQFSCQLNLWRKRREEQRKRSNNLLCRSFWFTTTVSALLPLPFPLHPFPFFAVAYLKSRAAWETKSIRANWGSHESNRVGLFMTVNTWAATLLRHPPSLLNPFALRVACMLIVCLLFVVIPNTKESERSMRVWIC